MPRIHAYRERARLQKKREKQSEHKPANAKPIKPLSEFNATVQMLMAKEKVGLAEATKLAGDLFDWR